MNLASMAPDALKTAKEEISHRWLALEDKVQPVFFLQWVWISLWFQKLKRPPVFVVVLDADKNDIACGFFVHHQQRRHKFFSISQLRLHSTGVREVDDINIEYNDLLCEPARLFDAWDAVIDGFLALRGQQGFSWDEIVLQGATDIAQDRLSNLGYEVHQRREQSAAFVDLKSLRQKNVFKKEDYINSLGKSTRAQLRRSIRLYESKGPLQFIPADGLDQAQVYLTALSQLHNEKWNRLGRVGSMESRFFSEFSFELLTACFREGRVEILRAQAGDHLLGYIYNFLNHDTAYFYLSGFVNEDDNKLKPGLVTHCLAIERYLNQGLDVYDFMGGDNRYKTNLGSRGASIVTFALQRATPILKIEALIRKMRNGILKPRDNS